MNINNYVNQYVIQVAQDRKPEVNKLCITINNYISQALLKLQVWKPEVIERTLAFLPRSRYRYVDLLKLKGNKRLIGIELLKQLQRKGVLDERCRFTRLNPTTGKAWTKLEKGVIYETFCKKVGKTQVDWKTFQLMNTGKDKEDWNEDDDMAVKRLSANVRKLRDPSRTKTYLLLDPHAYKETIDLCSLIDNFDSRKVLAQRRSLPRLTRHGGTRMTNQSI